MNVWTGGVALLTNQPAQVADHDLVVKALSMLYVPCNIPGNTGFGVTRMIRHGVNVPSRSINGWYNDVPRRSREGFRRSNRMRRFLK